MNTLVLCMKMKTYYCYERKSQMIPAPMSMYILYWLHATHMRMGRGVLASLSQLVRWYMCGQCTVYLSVGGTVELNRFLLPDSREIFSFFLFFFHSSFTPTHKKEGKNILYKNQFLPY